MVNEMFELGKVAHFRYQEPAELAVGNIPHWIKRLRSYPSERKGYRAIEMPWGEVMGTPDLMDLKQVAHWVDLFLSMAYRTFRVPLLLPISVVVFPTAKEFDKYCVECGGHPQRTAAFYESERAEIAVGLRKDPILAGLQFNLAHETTHAYMDLAVGFLGPPWFAEGLADYFGYFYLRRGLPAPGALLPEFLWEAHDVADHVELSKLFQHGFKEFYKDFSANYSVSFALVHYFVSRVGLEKLFNIVYEGRSSDLLKYNSAFRKELEEFAGPPTPPPGYQEGQLLRR